MRRLLSAFFSFEATLVLFLFAGKFKGDDQLQWLPVDVTALFFCMSFLIGLLIYFQRIKRQQKNYPVIYLLANTIFFLWCLASYTWSASTSYGMDKLASLLTLTFWAAISTSSIVGVDSERSERFYSLIVIFSLVSVIEAIKIIANQGGGFVSAFGSNYLALGTTLGAGSIILVSKYMSGKISAKVALPFLGLFVLIMLYGGGRGPVVALLLAVVVLFLTSAKSNKMSVIKSSLRLWLLVACGFISFILASRGLFSNDAQTLRRFGTLFTMGGDSSSAAARLSSYSDSIDLWVSSPWIGGGIGSFSVFSTGMDIRAYPHNIFLEILSEVGIFGFILFSASLSYIFWRFLTLPAESKRPEAITALGLSVFYLQFAQLSGDLNDNRMLFASLGMLAATTFICQRSQSSRST